MFSPIAPRCTVGRGLQWEEAQSSSDTALRELRHVIHAMCASLVSASSFSARRLGRRNREPEI